MTVREFLKRLEGDGLKDTDERKSILKLVLDNKILSPLSQDVLIFWQMGYIERHLPLYEFYEKQNEIIVDCISLELSRMGKTRRLEHLLKPLFLDSAIENNMGGIMKILIITQAEMTHYQANPYGLIQEVNLRLQNKGFDLSKSTISYSTTVETIYSQES